MRSLTYTISSAIFAAHPAYRRAVVVFSDLNNSVPNQELHRLLREAEEVLRGRIRGSPADFPQIAAWREAYRSFGAKPSEHRSSIEALARRVLKPDELPNINSLVDIGNLISLRHLLPAGVHPMAEGAISVELRQARAGDQFLPTDGAETESVPPGEIILAEGSRVLTRRWTWRQAGDTRTLPTTRTVFMDIDGLPPVTEEQVEAAIVDAIELVTRYCAGSCIGLAVLDAARPCATFQVD